MQPLHKVEIARLIDHTHVRAQASQTEITQLCDEAVQNNFATVCVNPTWVSYSVRRLAGSTVKVSSTVGFPLGANTARLKVDEAREAVGNGAGELDMVINIGALKSGFPDFVEQEIAAVVKAAGKIPVKVILETSYLTRDEKMSVCLMSMRAGAAFVKTCTGFSNSGADPLDVALMRKVVGNKLGVKASGGIRDYADAMKMIEAGANRIGTSTGVDIVNEAPA